MMQTCSDAARAEDRPSHSRLTALIQQAQRVTETAPTVAIVYPCDAPAIKAAQQIMALGIARPLLVGPRMFIESVANEVGVDLRNVEIADTPGRPVDAAHCAVALARSDEAQALMKGSIHTDELMTAFVHRDAGMRRKNRMSHIFLFDLPNYPKLLGLTDCAINIAPTLATKRDILDNAIECLNALGNTHPKVGVLAAVETVNPSIMATVDARALSALAKQGIWPGAQVEGPLGFDNAFSAEAAHMKNIKSNISGDADLLLVPDLNAGNMLYKSFTHVGGGDCAGLVLGARVPLVMTSRSDSALARIASVALAVLTALRNH